MVTNRDAFVDHEFSKIKNKLAIIGKSKGFFGQLKSFLLVSETIKITPALYKFSLDNVKIANPGKNNYNVALNSFISKIKNEKAKKSFQRALASKDGITLMSIPDIVLGALKKNKLKKSPVKLIKQNEVLESAIVTTLTVAIAVLFFYELYVFITTKPHEEASEEVADSSNEIRKNINQLYTKDEVIPWHDMGVAVLDFVIIYILIQVIRKIMSGYIKHTIPEDQFTLYNSILVVCVIGVLICIYKYFVILIEWVKRSTTLGKARLLITVLVSFIIIYEKFGKDFYDEYKLWYEEAKDQI